MKNWMYENLHEGFNSGFRAEKVLIDIKTDFQHLVVFENALFGKVMLIDDVLQTTEADEYIYHESITHLPIFAHGEVKRVLVIGGGDGGTAEEVLKHNSIKHITLVEIDSTVIEISKKYLRCICKDAFEDKRLEVVICDARKFVKNYCGLPYDLIIIDSTDPIGPAVSLFSESFYIDCKNCLATGGILITQNGVPFLQKTELCNTLKVFNKLFSDSTCYIANIPTYVGGPMAFGWGTDKLNTRKTSKLTIYNRLKMSKIILKHYNADWHKSAFILPNYIKDLTINKNY
ncbi:MAG: spermidine synthase [Rhodospirillaceae bacterium]|nr:spermidine synthase [Rhodospirillaceae bacterium]